MVTKQKSVKAKSAAAAAPQPNVMAKPAQLPFGFTAENAAFLASLKFVSASGQLQAVKTPSDVGEAFSAGTVATIRESALLGGPERADSVATLMKQHQQLLELSKIIEPMARRVSQNLLVVGGDLFTHASEVVKTARANAKTRPELLEGIRDAEAWMAKHHPGRPGKATEPAPEKK